MIDWLSEKLQLSKANTACRCDSIIKTTKKTNILTGIFPAGGMIKHKQQKKRTT